MRQLVEEVEEMAKDIVTPCVNRKKLELEVSKYLHEDEKVRTDILMTKDELQVQLEKELRCNFNLERNVTTSPENLREENACWTWGG